MISNYKEGYCHITQGWPNYHSGKSAKIGRKHTGIDCSCGAGNLRDAVAYAVEGGEVLKIRKGNKFRTGYVKIRGATSKHIYIYKHLGAYRRQTGGFFCGVSNHLSAGDPIGSPDYSLTKVPHLHLTVYDENNNMLNPIEVLLEVCPYLKFSFAKSLYVREYYEKTDPELLERMEARNG